MSREDAFKPYGCIISSALCCIIDEILWLNEEELCIKGEFNENICELIVSFLSVPITVIIEHGSYETLVTLTSLTRSHNVLYRFPSVVGATKQLVGNDAVNKLSSLTLHHPIKNGIITKHSLLQMDKIWNYIFNDLLLKNPPKYKISSHSVLLIIPPQTMHNIQICDKMIEFMFQIYNVPAVAIMDKASLSCHYYCYCYSSTNYYKKTGLIVDIGHDICTICPVFNFKSDLNKMNSTKLFSAKSIEQYICNILNENQFPSEIANGLKEIDNIKKNYIKIAESREKYEYILSNSFYDGIEYISTDNKLHCWIANWILYDIGEYIFNPFKYQISFPHYIDVKNWLYPKTALKLKRFTINENDKYSYLFTKKKKKKRYNDFGESETETDDDDDEDKENKKEFKLKGLAEMIFDVVMEYDDIEIRQNLLNNIILTGGMSFIHGIGDRLKKEIIDLVINKPDVLIKDYIQYNNNKEIDYDSVCSWITVIVGDRRNECNSICASILTSMPSMANIWLLRDEYFSSLSQDNL